MLLGSTVGLLQKATSPRSGNVMDVSEIIMNYTLQCVCQLYLKKTERKKKSNLLSFFSPHVIVPFFSF